MRTDVISELVAAKAERLLLEDRVTWLRGHMYQVVGSNDTYTVYVGYPHQVEGACSCPAKTHCSHLLAACTFELANPVADPPPLDDPFAGL